MTKTQVFTSVDALQNYLSSATSQRSVGFVPTMGALHLGHISLVHEAQKKCDIVVVSIFVNPTQFNDSNDLEQYPRTLDADVELLERNADCVVFAPSVREMYPENHAPTKIDLGKVGEVLEGSFREGHFDGVVEVVYRLFDIVKPNCAFFGEKDFQQLVVIRKMVDTLNLGIDVVGCPIYREPSGLAASSRNQRLSGQEKEDALILYHSLLEVKSRTDQMTPNEAKRYIEDQLEKSPLQLEYIEFIDANSFETVSKWGQNTQACIAAYCGTVRLIDNMLMD